MSLNPHLTRRQFIATTSLAAAGLTVPGCSTPRSAAQEVTPAALADATGAGVVRVQQGLLKGVVQDGVLVLRGVPFATPPVGALRFRPPQPAAQWEGLRDAISNGPAAIQPDTTFTQSTDEYLGAKRSEDCLYLNIWAPVGSGPHPVFVWVHGGANEFGSATEPLFDGANFARRGVVCVNVSYRVGILGFLELGEILGPGYRGSSANGLKDIVAALGWVRDNIRAVGGDPARVTVGGESAGGRNVTTLLAAPSARGLFQSAIIESGGQAIHTLKAAQANARIVAESIEAKGGKPQDILALPPDAIVALQTELGKRFNRPSYNRAVVDGDFLPEAPLAAIAKGSAKHIRVLIGTNRDEMAIFTNAEAAGRPLAQSEMTHMELADAEPIYQKYAAAYPELSPLALRIRFLSAEEYWLTCMRVAQAHQRTVANNTWVYRFDRESASGPLAGWVAHGAELPFVWNYLDEPIYGRIFGPKNAIDQKIADEMHGRWVKFISGDAPDVPRAPSWPSFDDQEQILIFGENTKLGTLDKAELALWPK